MSKTSNYFDLYVRPDEPISDAVDRICEMYLRADKAKKKELKKAYEEITQIDNKLCNFRRWNQTLN